MQSSGLPWTLPKKFSLDLSNLTDTIGGTVGVCVRMHAVF